DQESRIRGPLRVRPGSAARRRRSQERCRGAHQPAHGGIVRSSAAVAARRRRMIWSRIVGTGSYLPPRIVTNDEFAKRLDTSDEWIRERTGIAERRIADESQASSDLALEASRAALAAAQLAPGDIDLIIVATSTPDFVFPSTACLLQAKLGIKNSPA